MECLRYRVGAAINFTVPLLARAQDRRRADEKAMSIHRFKCFAADETGATAIEYGLIAALISVAIVGASMFLGGGISNTFNYVATQITCAGN